jgi:rhamnulokinase
MWDRQMIERLGLPPDLLTEIVSAGTDLGPVKASIADELLLESLRVIAPATHDTASAVAGAPLKDGWAYISSGTWSLVGVEREGALINADVARYNFTNEGGAFGTIRFLKNVMGLWILESCRSEWKERGFDFDYTGLLRRIETLDGCRALIFPDDPRFFNPPSMLTAIAEQLAESGQSMPDDPPVITKMILDSLAFRYASVLRAIESLTDQVIKGVQIIGGGSRNNYLNQMTATVTGKPVIAGPVEATVTGNVLVQAIAAEAFASLTEAREYVAQNVEVKRFNPRSSPVWEEATRRYEAIEARFRGKDFD